MILELVIWCCCKRTHFKLIWQKSFWFRDVIWGNIEINPFLFSVDQRQLNILGFLSCVVFCEFLYRKDLFPFLFPFFFCSFFFLLTYIILIWHNLRLLLFMFSIGLKSFYISGLMLRCIWKAIQLHLHQIISWLHLRCCHGIKVQLR